MLQSHMVGWLGKVWVKSDVQPPPPGGLWVPYFSIGK